MSITSSYGNNVLMPFDCFVDTDYGLIKLIKEKYNNKNIVYKSIVESEDIFMLYLLMNRGNENPLSIALEDKYISSQDKLRSEFLDKEYNSILDLSITNEIFNLLKMMQISGAITVDILCKNEMEQKYISKLLGESNINIIIAPDLTKVDISSYDSIFVKNYKDILSYRNLVGKNIYILDYKFNIQLGIDDKPRPLLDVEMFIGIGNTTSIISTYNLSEVKIYG